MIKGTKSECDKYIWIFKYSNISVTNIYSDIRSYQLFDIDIIGYSWVSNIFGLLFVSVQECLHCLNVRIYSNIHTILITNIYSDIRSCQICYTNIFGHLFVYIFWCKYIRIFVRVKKITNVTHRVTLWTKSLKDPHNSKLWWVVQCFTNVLNLIFS